jgi:putative chitinase
VAELFAAYAKEAGLPKRELCSLVANCIVETGNLTPKWESFNYNPQGLRTIWPMRFSVPLSEKLGRHGGQVAQVQEIAEVVYGGRMGNTQPGDAFTYRGGGLIQVTGRDNYKTLGDAMGEPLVLYPDLLQQAGVAVRAALTYWRVNNLSETLRVYGPVGVGNKINTGSPRKGAHGGLLRLALFERLVGSDFDY